MKNLSNKSRMNEKRTNIIILSVQNYFVKDLIPNNITSRMH